LTFCVKVKIVKKYLLFAHQQAGCTKVMPKQLVLVKPPTFLKDTDAIFSYMEDQMEEHHHKAVKK
jgi:hypothetical protein